MRARAALGLMAGAALLSGCATLTPAACPTGQSPGRTVHLLFGARSATRSESRTPTSPASSTKS